MNPLDDLEPVIEPAAVSWWPPAPGWWLLAALLLVGAAGFGLWRRRRARARPLSVAQLRRAGLAELAKMAGPSDQAGPWLQQVNNLLKRLCQARYPNENPQRLSGQAWLDYLDRHCPAAGLGRWPELAEGAYQARCQLTEPRARELRLAVEAWIRQHA